MEGQSQPGICKHAPVADHVDTELAHASSAIGAALSKNNGSISKTVWNL